MEKRRKCEAVNRQWGSGSNKEMQLEDPAAPKAHLSELAHKLEVKPLECPLCILMLDQKHVNSL